MQDDQTKTNTPNPQAGKAPALQPVSQADSQSARQANSQADSLSATQAAAQAAPQSAQQANSQAAAPTAAQAAPQGKKRRFSAKNLSIIPNACTSMNIVCGFISIIFTSHQEFLLAGWLIIIANIFDILDGRLARLTSVESRFGAELDSLCDLVSFGVAPAFLVYTRYLSANRVCGLIVTTIFVLCGSIRLARFNVTPHSSHDVFIGLPIPAGAGILATMTIFELQFFNFIRIPTLFIPFLVVLTAFLMVSTIEYPAMKKNPSTTKLRILTVVMLLIVFIINPPASLFFLIWGYAAYGMLFAFIKLLNSILKKKRRPKTCAAA